MAFVIAKGSASEIKAVDATGTKNLTAWWIDGSPEISDDVVDVTTIADLGHRNNRGLQNASISMTFMYDSTATGPYHHASARRAEDTARNVIFYPGGTASGQAIITVGAKLSGVSFGMAVGDRVTMALTWVLDGTGTVAGV